MGTDEVVGIVAVGIGIEVGRLTPILLMWRIG